MMLSETLKLNEMDNKSNKWHKGIFTYYKSNSFKKKK